MINKLKILFIAQCHLRRELGGPKVVIELSEAISELGHEVVVIGTEEINLFLKENSIAESKIYEENIKSYLKVNSKMYDIIDVDAFHLYEFLKDNKETKPLVVARSVLFHPHKLHITWPERKTLKSNLSDLFRKKNSYYSDENINKRVIRAIGMCDLINVSNHEDVELLIKEGVSKEKIICLPFGLSSILRHELESIAHLPKKENNIVFLGTFDFRKGCIDIPKIFYEVKKVIPDARLTLLGVKGLFSSSKEILSFFPKSLRISINIVLEYKQAELPGMLKSCKLAIFPSYLEGFGFSVIELMAAGIPVIAYNSPGPSSILPKKFLVNRGDYLDMANKINIFLMNMDILSAARAEMQNLSKKFKWELIAQETIKFYKLSAELKKENFTSMKIK